MLPEGDERLSQWRELARNSSQCMEDAKRIAVAGYRQVLEDGPEVCSSQSEAEDSDNGEQALYAEMYTPDILGYGGKPVQGRASLTTEQANVAKREEGQEAW
jgi:hypothetical protein